MLEPNSYLVRNKTAYKFRFYHPDTRKRTWLRIGVVTKAIAIEFGIELQKLIDAYEYQTDLPAGTVHWLSKLPDRLYNKLVSAGLICERQSAEKTNQLKPFLDDYIAAKSGGGSEGGGWKQKTKENREKTVNDLVQYFGPSKNLSQITKADALPWRNWLMMTREPNLAGPTVSKRIKDARQFFEYAVDLGLIPKNPFASLRLPPQDNPDRLRYVTTDEINRVLAQIVDPAFRFVVVAARYAGMRIPSEVYRLRWKDVDLKAKTMLVRAPKTEAYARRGQRVCPIFPELRPVLNDLQKARGQHELVLGDLASLSRSNLRTQFGRYIERAGLEPWPRVFQNLRASALTDLVESHSLPKVCKWLGNSPNVAMHHYFMLKGKELDRDGLL